MRTLKKYLAAALCMMMVMAMFTGCGSKSEASYDLDPDAVVATVGDDEITLQEAYFMLKWQQAEYQTMASSIYGDEWYNEDLEGDGQTFLEYLKESIMERIEDMHICRQQAEALGVSITEEEEEEIAEAVSSYLSSNNDDALDAMMADEEIVTEVLENYTIYMKVYNAVVADADTSVTDEEARQATYSYIYQDFSTTDEDGNETELTDSEKEEYYALFELIAAAAEESGDFDQAAEDAGYETASHTYTVSSYSDDSFYEINAIADELEVGEVSDLITVDGGLALIYLDTDNDEEETEDVKQELAEEKQAQFFEDWIDPLREEAAMEIDEELWAEVGFEKALAAVSD